MKASAKELEVISEGDDDTHHDEDGEVGTHHDHADNAERGGTAKTHYRRRYELPLWNRGRQWSAHKFIERVGAHTHAEKERRQRHPEVDGVDGTDEAGSNSDEGEVEHRVGRVEQGPPLLHSRSNEKLRFGVKSRALRRTLF